MESKFDQHYGFLLLDDGVPKAYQDYSLASLKPKPLPTDSSLGKLGVQRIPKGPGNQSQSSHSYFANDSRSIANPGQISNEPEVARKNIIPLENLRNSEEEYKEKEGNLLKTAASQMPNKIKQLNAANNSKSLNRPDIGPYSIHDLSFDVQSHHSSYLHKLQSLRKTQNHSGKEMPRKVIEEEKEERKVSRNDNNNNNARRINLVSHEARLTQAQKERPNNDLAGLGDIPKNQIVIEEVDDHIGMLNSEDPEDPDMVSQDLDILAKPAKGRAGNLGLNDKLKEAFNYNLLPSTFGSYMKGLEKLRRLNPDKSRPQLSKNIFMHNNQEEVKANEEAIAPIASDSKVEGIVSLSIKTTKAIINSSTSEELLVPIVVSFEVEQDYSVDCVPVDIVCVIDIGPTMHGLKIEAVKDAFSHIASNLGDFDRISVILFNEKAENTIPFAKTNKPNMKRILQTVQEIECSGSTSDLSSGLGLACKVLWESQQSNLVQSIFLISDKEGSLENIKGLSIPKNVIINTFGLGKQNPEVMLHLTSIGDGNFYSIGNLNTLGKALNECMMELTSVVAQDVEITVKAEQSNISGDLCMITPFGTKDLWTSDNTLYSRRLPLLRLGLQHDYVFYVRIPPIQKELKDHEKNIKVAKAELAAMDFKGRTIFKSVELYVTVLNEIEEIQDDEDEIEIIKEVTKKFFRTQVAFLIDLARKKADEGKYEEARNILLSFYEEVVNSIIKEQESVVKFLKDIVDILENLEPNVYKELGRQYIICKQRALKFQKSTLPLEICN